MFVLIAEVSISVVAIVKRNVFLAIRFIDIRFLLLLSDLAG